MSRIIIAGGSGFVGQALVRALGPDHEVVVLARSPKAPNEIAWDGRNLGAWIEKVSGARAVINLAGTSITLPFTSENRKLILDSRVDSTRVIRHAIETASSPPSVWVNASAIGYYGDRGDEILDESSEPGTGFLADTCQAWESEVSPRATRLRLGIVLGREGGTFPILAKLTKSFLGSAQGSGKQFTSWIHIDDLIGILLWLIDRPVAGPINAVAPSPVRNQELMATLRSLYGRPWVPNVPEGVLKLIGRLHGPDIEVVLGSQCVRPAVLAEGGFAFQYPGLADALRDLTSGG